MAMIRTFCGGRAAEELIFGSITTGASNDIERATRVARQMITMYGMSDEFGFVALESIENQYLDGRSVMNCSDVTAAKIDEAVRLVMKECYEQAKKLLSENEEILRKAAEFLISKETITGKQFMVIFHSVKNPETVDTDGAEKAIAEGTDSSVEAKASDTQDNSGEMTAKPSV